VAVQPLVDGRPHSGVEHGGLPLGSGSHLWIQAADAARSRVDGPVAAALPSLPELLAQLLAQRAVGEDVDGPSEQAGQGGVVVGVGAHVDHVDLRLPEEVAIVGAKLEAIARFVSREAEWTK